MAGSQTLNATPMRQDVFLPPLMAYSDVKEPKRSHNRSVSTPAVGYSRYSYYSHRKPFMATGRILQVSLPRTRAAQTESPQRRPCLGWDCNRRPQGLGRPMSLYASTHCAMKTYWGVKIQLHAFIRLSDSGAQIIKNKVKWSEVG
jgi:hypothetical protein